ncbi:MAG: glutathione S-transferase family protein [bacterium]|nr:glutathione S-transferase family protein [bacterium]
MIDLYTWPTPNGLKISIALEEMGLDYTVHPVNLGAEEQFSDEFVKISPASKIPAIVDNNGPSDSPYSVFESGSILIYLAEKSGCFLPEDPHLRLMTLEWLMFQLSAVGPMLGQLGHFKMFASEKIPYAINRYTKESTRTLKTLNRRLHESEYLAGDYSIADIATYPWVVSAANRIPLDLSDMPNLERWLDQIEIRPAVQKGMTVPAPKSS